MTATLVAPETREALPAEMADDCWLDDRADAGFVGARIDSEVFTRQAREVPGQLWDRLVVYDPYFFGGDALKLVTDSPLYTPKIALAALNALREAHARQAAES